MKLMKFMGNTGLGVVLLSGWLPAVGLHARTDPLDNTAFEEAPVEEVSVAKVSVGEVSVREMPVQERPVGGFPVWERPVWERPVRETPVWERPVQETPVRETPVREMPVREMPVRETSVAETSVGESSVGEMAQSDEKMSVASVDRVTTESDAPVILEEIVVEPEGEPEPRRPLGIGVGGETLRTTPGSAGDPLRSLQAFPGMAYTDDQSALPAVRGSRPEDNFFVADTVPVGYLFHAGGVVSVFNSDLIESFEIYSSAYGPAYAGGNGAVFDVRLRDPARDEFNAVVDISMLQAGALIEGPLSETSSFYLAGRFSYLDLLVADQLEEEDGIDFIQFPRYSDYQGKYVWRPHKNTTVRVQATGAADEQELEIASDSTVIEQEPIFEGRHFDRTRFDEQSLVWEQGTGDRLRGISTISRANGSSRFQAGGAGRGNVTESSYLLKSDLVATLNEEHDIAFGGSLTRIEADLGLGLNDPSCTEFEADCQISGADRREIERNLTFNSFHAHVQDSWYANDRLTLMPGLSFRADDVLDGRFLEPRLALEYELGDDTTLSAAIGQYHQLPGYLETDRDFGNPDLEHIGSRQAVVGFQRVFENGLDFKTELFHKRLDKLVTGDESTRYSNDGEGTAYGLDMLVRGAIDDRLSGWAALSLSRAERKNRRTEERFDFSYDQPFNISVVADYRITDEWRLGAKLWVHSGATYTPVTGAEPDDEIEGYYNPQYGRLNSKRFPTYHRLDLRVAKTLTRRSGNTTELYAEVLNVLDTKNVAYYDYSADYTERTAVGQLPRIAGVGIKMTY